LIRTLSHCACFSRGGEVGYEVGHLPCRKSMIEPRLESGTSCGNAVADKPAEHTRNARQLVCAPGGRNVFERAVNVVRGDPEGNRLACIVDGIAEKHAIKIFAAPVPIRRSLFLRGVVSVAGYSTSSHSCADRRCESV